MTTRPKTKAKLKAKPTAPAKRGRGRPEEKATQERRDQVKQLTAYGLTKEQMCTVMGISKKTLLKHYAVELEAGLPMAAMMTGAALIKAIRSGNMTAVIWYEKTRLGMAERHELTGKKGGPIQHEHEHEPSEFATLSDADLSAMVAVRARRSGDGTALAGGDPVKKRL